MSGNPVGPSLQLLSPLLYEVLTIATCDDIYMIFTSSKVQSMPATVSVRIIMSSDRINSYMYMYTLC